MLFSRDQTPLTVSNMTFSRLPTEIHAEIVSYLPYPDALALKHTNSYFYSLVRTGPGLKVDWVIDRFRLRLQVPKQTCIFRTDESFCRGEIRYIMERRRMHLECRRGDKGCMVVEGSSCGAGSALSWLKRHKMVKKYNGIFLGNAGMCYVFRSVYPCTCD